MDLLFLWRTWNCRLGSLGLGVGDTQLDTGGYCGAVPVERQDCVTRVQSWSPGLEDLDTSG